MKGPDFIQVPYLVYEDETLNPTDKFLYGIIYWLVRLKNEKCTASNETLAQLLYVRPRAIRSGLERLEKAGYIQRVFSDEKGKIRDEIVPLVAYAKVGPNEPTQRSKQTSPLGLFEPQKKNIVHKSKEDIHTVFLVWNAKNIIHHKTLSPDAEREIKKLLDKGVSVKDIADTIALYAFVLKDQNSYWSHKWNLYEFIKRGYSRFEGKGAADFIRTNGAPNTAPKTYV